MQRFGGKRFWNPCLYDRRPFRIGKGVDLEIGSGILIFKDGSTFHFNEVHLQNTRKYRFHYMDYNRCLICRWDNAPHHQELKTFPDHAHFPVAVRESESITLIAALRKIEEWVSDRLSKEIES
jgi:hypothetical protein